MKTTMLIVEFLVGGILVLLALIFLIGSVFLGDILAIPRTLAQILYDPNQCQPQSTGILLLLSTIFVAIAYAVGILLAPVAREMFEWMIRSVKKGRLEEYFDRLEKDEIDRTKIPFLKNLKVNKDQVPAGAMRFDVLMKSPELYQDIVSQLHRYRLMRLSFLAETILILAVVVQLLQENSSTSMWALALIAVISVFVFPPIYDRFERYCKAIGRPNKTEEKSNKTEEKSNKMKMKVIRLLLFALYALVVVSFLQLLQEDSSPLISLLAILILIAALNVVIIRDRFERYCRSIERSFAALILAEKTKMSAKSSQNQNARIELQF
ncbi:MAG: hypothetical protein HXS46_19935 [Theionarchaea archaeon]|nr:hypothetical protein [Theionarchaea archaeon]